MIRYSSSTDIESLYIDDNWRLTQEVTTTKLRIFGITVWKNVETIKHKLPPKVLFTTAVKGKESQLGFTSSKK